MGMGRLSTKWSLLVNNWVNRSVELLFPPGCLFCQAPLDQSGCCPACLDGIRPHPATACHQCGVALADDLAPGPCGKCLASPPFQQQTVSLFCYQGPVRDAILNWKLGGEDAAVRWLVESSAPLLRTMIRPDDLLLPVPMPLSRMRKSGQHHAANLARMMAAVAGCAWDWQLLKRVGEQERQSALSGVARRKNLRKSFGLNSDHWEKHWKSNPVTGKIWVVDDILTTGATLNYASKALRALKQPVSAFSLARTPTKE